MDYPDLLGNVIPFILSSLSNPKVAVSSTMALKELTRNCQKYLCPFAEHILVAAQVCKDTVQIVFYVLIYIIYYT